MATDPSEPTTAAGRALLNDDACWDKPVLTDAILAIEAEARQPDSEALRRVVANLTKSLLIAQDGESVSGGTAAVLWLRDVITLAALPPKGEAIDSGEGRVVPSLGDFSTPPLPRSPSDPPTASDLRGLVTDPAWGEGHRASDPPALAQPSASIDVERLPVGVSDGLASLCEDCGDHPRFDYIVDDDFWRRWVTGPKRLGVVCLPCLDKRCGGVGLAEALGRVDWTGTGHTVSLRPSGRYSHDLTLHAEYARLSAQPEAQPAEDADD